MLRLLIGAQHFSYLCLETIYIKHHEIIQDICSSDNYADFEYGPLTCKQKRDKIYVTFELKNLGDMEADEVAQLYVKRIGSAVERPLKELEAFDRITLKAGETKKVTLEFPVSELAHWDNETNEWVLEHGKLEILVGSASNDIRQTIATEI